MIKLTCVAPKWVFNSNLLAPLLTAHKAYSIITPAAQTITARDNISCNTAVSNIPATMDHTPALKTNNFGPKVKRILLEKLCHCRCLSPGTCMYYVIAPQLQSPILEDVYHTLPLNLDNYSQSYSSAQFDTKIPHIRPRENSASRDACTVLSTGYM